MDFLTLPAAIAHAQIRANACHWEFSVLQRYNPHLRDYTLQVLPFRHDDAVTVVRPDTWPAR